MPATPSYSGRMTINATAFRLHSWDVRYFCDMVDTSHLENFGFEDWTGCLSGAEVSFDAIWRTEDNPFVLPMMLYPGLLLHSVRIWPNLVLDPGASWQFLQCQIAEMNMMSTVRDVVRYRGKFLNHATIVSPPTH